MNRLWISAISTLALASFGFGQHVRFIVSGDGRSAGKVSKRPEDVDGLNVKLNEELSEQVLKEKAQALLFTGDLVYGHADRAGLVKMLMHWRSIYEKDYAAGVVVLPCRGNHDAGDAGADEDAAWNEVFSGKYALPQDGPAHEKNLTFTKSIGNVLFVGLDQFTAIPDKVAIDQKWFDQVLDQNKKPFVFPFAHKMAFMDGHHVDGMDSEPALRDEFWQSLIKHKVRVFLCGHDHAYDHMKVVHGGAVPGLEVHQFTAGTAGAPFVKLDGYEGKNTVWKLTRVKSLTDHAGYLLVDVVGKKATITYKARNDQGQYEAYDTWSYQVR
jgi:hypothetical protein